MRSRRGARARCSTKRSVRLLGYVDEMADHGNVADATFDAVGRFFTPTANHGAAPSQFGSYYGTALIMNAMQIKLEPK